MPIRVPNDMPARAVLESENIFMMDENRAASQQIRPLQIVILNLMPVKPDYETQLLRSLSNTPLQVETTYLRMSSHDSKNTSELHLQKFYVTFDKIREQYFDGMIITGAPLEKMKFEDVDYWPELCEIMEWTKEHVTSTIHVCWGALAGLYYHYGIEKVELPKKLSGIYRHRVLDRRSPLVRSFDDVFDAPHSRYSGVRREDIMNHPDLKLLAESDIAGPYLIKSDLGQQIFVLGHPEYDRMALDGEYRRDIAAGLDPEVPYHYYENDDPANTPLLTWRGQGNTLYSNWLNFYVYQITPYVLGTEKMEPDYQI